MTVLIKLYANGCIYCQKMLPEWNKLKAIIGKRATIVEVEHNDLMKPNNELEKLNLELTTPIEAQGYPTIAKIKNKIVEYYNGDRTAKDMLLWLGMKHKSKSATKGGKKKKIKRKTRKNNRKN